MNGLKHPHSNKLIRWAILLTASLALAACGGGGGGSSSPPPTATPPPPPPPPPAPSGDDARRAVLADIGTQIILPALQAFATEAGDLQTAVAAHAAAPTDASALSAAQAAWDSAMDAWQRNEPLQVGPAGKSSNPDAVRGGQDLRNLIYSWPLTLNVCSLEQAALDADAVNTSTSIDITGLGALEHMLYTATADAACTAQPDASARAAHAERLADRIAALATGLVTRWDPAQDDFLAQWSTAGDGSVTYGTPQDALDSLSVGLFYVEQETKDRKVGLTTGIGSTQLTCGNAVNCPEFLESRLSGRSGANLRANIQTFRDVFTGLNNGMGLNDLLSGVDREDLATQIVSQLDVVLARLDTIANNGGFDAAVEGITDANECVNAFSSSSGLPPCALLGEMKSALDTFRVDIVTALSLAIPDSAAGDND
ncbi:MAG: imelysin family protein [Pseudomonadota bacterium]